MKKINKLNEEKTEKTKNNEYPISSIRIFMILTFLSFGIILLVLTEGITCRNFVYLCSFIVIFLVSFFSLIYLTIKKFRIGKIKNRWKLLHRKPLHRKPLHTKPLHFV